MNTTGLQTLGKQFSISSISETTGVMGNTTDGLANFKRIVDPDDATKSAYLFQSAYRDAAGSTGGKRSELTWHPTYYGHDIGGTYWTAIRVRVGDNVKHSSSADEVLLWQLQEHTGQAGLNPNMALIATGGGASSEIFARINYASSPVPSLKANQIGRTVYTNVGYPSNKWITFVMQFKLHHTAGKGAFFKMWKDGELVVNDTYPNAYNGGQETDPTKRNYQKVGIYHYYDNLWSAGQYRTVLHKGLITFKDDGKITESFVRSMIEGF